MFRSKQFYSLWAKRTILLCRQDRVAVRLVKRALTLQGWAVGWKGGNFTCFLLPLQKSLKANKFGKPSQIRGLSCPQILRRYNWKSGRNSPLAGIWSWCQLNSLTNDLCLDSPSRLWEGTSLILPKSNDRSLLWKDHRLLKSKTRKSSNQWLLLNCQPVVYTHPDFRVPKESASFCPFWNLQKPPDVLLMLSTF